MRSSRLGQYPTYRYPTYNAPYGSPTSMYPGGPVRFYRRIESTPGQPYRMELTPEEVEKAIYKDLSIEVKDKTKITGTTPQKLIKLKSGLEVPAYIIQRDIERKRKGVESRLLQQPVEEDLPLFHRVGSLSTDKPFVASILALAIGAFVGNYFYDIKHPSK